jgi:endonuclease/exonuclease/phosphatase family metal-dependent hydrolase
MKIIKTAFKTIGALIGIFLLYVILSIAYGTATEYQPQGVIALEDDDKGIPTLDKDSLSFVLWNVGYGGLGAESSFFFDDGRMLLSGDKMVNAPKELVEKNIKGIEDFVKTNNYDFYLFQEVDFASKRSRFINQYEKYGNALPGYAATFADNFIVKRVPLPILEPFNVMGRMHSGLATYSRYDVHAPSRIQLPGEHGWPDRIFQLDRCLAIHRVKIDSSEKELVVINTHNSAYDEDGFMKKQEMEFLKVILLEEYAKGNYIVVGGDWNQCPPNFKPNTFRPNITPDAYYQINVPADFLPADWKWAYDKNVPTNRKLVSPYRGAEAETFVTLIDFFLISPNIELVEVKGLDTDFEYSDHQAVALKVKLKN